MDGRIMKFRIDVDCTLEVARDFFGVPDVKAAQDAVMDQIEERMKACLAAMDPKTQLKTWLPANAPDLERMQKAFWSQFGGDKE